MGFQDINTEDFTDDFDMEGLGDDQMPDFDETGGGGISPIFKIIGALMVIVVLIIVVVLVLVAMRGSDKVTDRDQTRTAVAVYNATEIQGQAMTATSWQVALDVTGTRVAEINDQATVDALAITEAFNQGQTETAVAATAQFNAEQTAEAQTATAEFQSNMTATAAEEQRTIAGVLVLPGNVALGNTQVYLFRDNGDGIFSVADMAVVPTPIPTQAPTMDPSSLGPISQTETAIAISAPVQPTIVQVPT